MIQLTPIALFLIALTPIIAQAAGGASGDQHAGGIPVSGLIFQAINFFLFIGLLWFLLRKKIPGLFQSREQEFKQALLRAEAAKREAEQKRQEIQDRLSKLESTSAESIANARQEAEALKQKIVVEAQDLAKHLQSEAGRTAQVEIERAKFELREELLNQSVALSRKMLEEKMAEPDQKRLQTEFVDKIQVVR